VTFLPFIYREPKDPDRRFNDSALSRWVKLYFCSV